MLSTDPRARLEKPPSEEILRWFEVFGPRTGIVPSLGAGNVMVRRPVGQRETLEFFWSCILAAPTRVSETGVRRCLLLVGRDYIAVRKNVP